METGHCLIEGSHSTLFSIVMIRGTQEPRSAANKTNAQPGDRMHPHSRSRQGNEEPLAGSESSIRVQRRQRHRGPGTHLCVRLACCCLGSQPNRTAYVYMGARVDTPKSAGMVLP
eukprot:1151180-Pelagomonas_calceolata.AAC.2